MAFLGLARPFYIGKYAHNGVDYISDLLGELLFLWRLLLTLLLLVSLSTSVFRSVSSSVCFMVPMLLLMVSFRSCSYLVVFKPFDKLD